MQCISILNEQSFSCVMNEEMLWLPNPWNQKVPYPYTPLGKGIEKFVSGKDMTLVCKQVRPDFEEGSFSLERKYFLGLPGSKTSLRRVEYNRNIKLPNNVKSSKPFSARDVTWVVTPVYVPPIMLGNHKYVAEGTREDMARPYIDENALCEVLANQNIGTESVHFKMPLNEVYLQRVCLPIGEDFVDERIEVKLDAQHTGVYEIVARELDVTVDSLMSLTSRQFVGMKTTPSMFVDIVDKLWEWSFSK
jgi:hypothetical protein